MKLGPSRALSLFNMYVNTPAYNPYTMFGSYSRPALNITQDDFPPLNVREMFSLFYQEGGYEL